MLRRSFLACVASLLLAPAARAVPTTMTYAGFLTDGGVPVDGPVDLVIELYDARTGGVLLFSEAFQSFVVPDGDLVVEVGAVTPLDGALLESPELWLQATVDGNVMSPRARLSSVPYALQAGEAASLEGVTAADIQAQVDALQAQITALQTQATSLQASLNALASAGGPSVAFANVTGLAFQAPLSFSGGNATVSSGGITATHLATGSVAADEIATSAVGFDEIATNAVGADEIATGAVGSAEIASDAVGADEIATGAVGSAEIASDAVGAAELFNADTVYLTKAGCLSGPNLISSSSTCPRSTLGCGSGCQDCNTGVCGSANCGITSCPLDQAGAIVGP